jgi:hypothetical protein
LAYTGHDGTDALDEEAPKDENSRRGVMANNANERFLALLEQDVEMFQKAAEAWDEIGQHGGRLEDMEGKAVATAEEMAEKYRHQAKELRGLIAQRRE